MLATALSPLKCLGALPLLLAAWLALLAPPAQALGLGRPQILSVLGRPLDASFPLTLAEGERLTDSCLRAEVSAGDARVPAGLLQLRVEGEPGQWRVRLQSLVAIEEPALRITLALGCPVRFTREFHALVDPAAMPSPSPVAAPLVVAAAVPPPVDVNPRPAPSGANTRATALAPGVSRAELAAAARPAPAASPASRPARARPSAPARASGPRLRMEAPEVLVGDAPRPAAQAAQQELSPEMEATLTRLEQTVAELRAELEQRRAAPAASAVPASAPASTPTATSLPAPRVAAARPPAYRDPEIWWITLGLGLVAGALAFQASRWLDERQRRRRHAWRERTRARDLEQDPTPSPVAAFAPAVRGSAQPLPDDAPSVITSPQPRPLPWVTQAPLDPQSTLPVPVPATALAAAPLVAPAPPELTEPVFLPAAVAAPSDQSGPAVSPDEWLELEQQLDFLQRLGQPESAESLLDARLAQGGGGALPYLLRLELCERRGDATRFATLAQAFEARFGRLAPAWGQGAARGRPLEACPSVIAHLQVVWGEPVTALEMLSGLISQGAGPGVPAFDLPAYRDLLLLYAVARDLYEAEQRGDGVDLMLPLDSRL